MQTIKENISDDIHGEVRALQAIDGEVQAIHGEVQAIQGEVQALHASITGLEQRVHDQGVEINARGRLTDEFIKKLQASDTKFSELQPYFKHLLLKVD